MAETMQFDLVAPSRRVASMEASSVKIPGAEGAMTVMAGHLPVITTLRPGIVIVEGPEGQHDYAVTGGFAEINAEGATILAERAVERTGDNKAEIEQELETAREKAEKAEEHHEKDGAEAFVADLVKLLEDME